MNSPPGDALELSVRAENCLDDAEIKTVRELLAYTEDDLLKTKNFGLKSLYEITHGLGRFGLALASRKEGELAKAVRAELCREIRRTVKVRLKYDLDEDLAKLLRAVSAYQ